MQPKIILIVDDEASVRESLEKVISKAGYVTKSASSGNEARAILLQNPVDLVLSDLKMPDGNGLELLRHIRKHNTEIEVILLTGFGTISTAVEAMKEGAYDFITKPFKKAIILKTVEKALEKQNLSQENKYLKAQLGRAVLPDKIVGKSGVFKDVLNLVDRVAPLVSTVLISGESGTGKELLARKIHNQSPRNNKRFIPVNCAAIPETLIESELFGHVKGAFTGAIRDKEGLFKVANGGTLFLDEICSVPLNLQVKLLRAIEMKDIMPVGSTKSEIIDVRIIAATNKNLGNEVEKGNFREDLYYRLNVVGINIPPLRERKEDIPELIRYFVGIYNIQLNKQVKGVDDDVLEAFMDYPWRGNVRELENVIERAMILADGNILTMELFPQLTPYKPSSGLNEVDLKDSIKNFERTTIIKALKISANDKAKAAELLGMSQSTLYRKLSELSIPSKIE